MKKNVRRLRMPRIQLSLVGVICGFAGYFVALTPSLMPRPAVFMGIVAGIGFTLAYCAGVWLGYALRRWTKLPAMSRAMRRTTWRVLAGVLPVFLVVTSVLARMWQNEQRALLDEPQITSIGVPTILLVALAVCVALMALYYAVRWLYGAAQRRWGAKLSALPPRVSRLIVAVVVTFVIVGIASGVLERTALVAINSSYRASNARIDPTLVQPTSEFKSGSPESSVSWTGLGREGRRFVATGPTADEIAAFNNQPATEPIRVYAGLDNATNRQAQVALVMRELERTGAFGRKQLMVATPTGSGWLESETMAAFEYMHGGNTAIVSAQYSFLPSGLSYVIDRGDAGAMAKELLHAVEAKLRTLPVDTRPKLVVYGLSLGSYGGQSDFTSEADFASRVDAALFVGTPGFSEPWRTFTRERDAGSPQIEPIYNHARVIKFVTDSEEVIGVRDPQYKVLYFQYATDPFVWFDARLLYDKPDWMSEPPGRGVSPRLQWVPVVTFLQVAIDQIYSLTIPGNNGHDYSHDTVAPLAAVTRPDDWSVDKARKLQQLIAPVREHGK